MVRPAPRAGGNVGLATGGQGRRPAPLLITAQLPPYVLGWADAIRRAHYPHDRNRLPAHVTLFHGLPPSAGGEIRAVLAQVAAAHLAPAAQVSGIMPLGGGTAFKVTSAALVAIHEELLDRFYGILSQQDSHRLNPHITVQNKVPEAEARQLQASLQASFKPRKFGFPGLALHLYRDGLWEFVQSWRFRGNRVVDRRRTSP